MLFAINYQTSKVHSSKAPNLLFSKDNDLLKIFTPSSDDAWVLKGTLFLFWKRFEATLNVQYRCRDWYWFSFLRFLDQKVVLKAVLSYLSFPIVSCHSCSSNNSSDFIEVKPLYMAVFFFESRLSCMSHWLRRNVYQTH